MAYSIVTYGALHYIWLFPFVTLGLGALFWHASRVHTTLPLLTQPHHRAVMFSRFTWFRFFARILLVASALITLWFALLRPQYVPNQPEHRYEYSRDIVIAIDISRSMLVEDCAGLSRLTLAKKKIHDLLQQLPSDRVALIVFSGTALVMCPLTKDATAFHMFVESLDTEILSGSTTTSLSAALRSSIQLFKEEDARKHKLVVIFTDGEDFSFDFNEAQKEASDAGLAVSVIGVGSSQGGPIPLYNEQGSRIGHQRDAQGNIVISRLQEQKIQHLITASNGRYSHIDETGNQDIAQIGTWIQQYEREQGVSFMTEIRNDLYMFCSGWSAWALAIAWMI